MLFADVGDYVRVTDVYVTSESDRRNYARDSEGELADVLVNGTGATNFVVRNVFYPSFFILFFFSQ